MIFSIVALALSLSLFFFPGTIQSTTNSALHLSVIISIAGTAILLTVPLVNTLFLIPLQKAEQNLAPRLVSCFLRDRPLIWITIALLSFSFFSYTLFTALALFDRLPKTLLVAVWIFSLGLSLDLLRCLIRRSLSYLDPFTLVDRFVQSAKEAIRQNQDVEMFRWIDAIADISMKGIDKHSSSLSVDSLKGLMSVFQAFLDACKSLSHPSQDAAMEAATGVDEVSYTVFYVINRLEMVYTKALDKRLEPLCSQVVATLGKMTLMGARLDISLATFPIQILGKLAVKAQERDIDDVAIKATGVLLEVAKSILNEINITYMELKPPFFALINDLENIAKMSFRKDKTTNIKILVEPLENLQAIVSNEKYASHPDIPAIGAEIKRVLGEFAVLEQVLRTIPPIPKGEPTPQGQAS